MAKVRFEWLDPDGNPWNFYTYLYHDGGPPWSDDCRHSVWACYWFQLPGALAWMDGHPTLDQAFLEAKTLVAMPMVARDLCGWCRNLAYGSTAPRWNIYRGENRMIVPITLLWDRSIAPPP